MIYKKNLISTLFINLLLIISAGIYAEENTIVIASNGLVLRNEPTQKSKKIDIIPFKTTLKIIEYSSNEENINGISAKWAKVKYLNNIGWVFCGFLEGSIKKEYIILPNSIYPQNIPNNYVSFDCYERNWQFSDTLNPTIKNNVLYVNSLSFIYSAVGEYNQKPIFLKSYKKIVFEFEKIIEKHIIIKSIITTDKSINNTNFYDCYNKNKVEIPLAVNGNLINHIQFAFKGEKYRFGIKSIYLE